MPEKIVISQLDIDTAALARKNAELLAQITSLKTAQKDLKDATSGLSTASETQLRIYAQTDAQLKKVNADYNQNKTVLAEATTGVRSLSDALQREVNTVQQASKSNKELVKLRSQVNVKTKEGQKAIQQINTKLNQNNEMIKKNVSALEKQRMNIGNYASALDRLVPGLGSMITNIQGTTAAVKGSTSGLKAWKIALASTGVGLILIALGSLVSYFNSSEEGANSLNKVLTQIGIVIGNVSDIIADFGKLLFNALTGNTEGVKQAWQDVTDGVKNFVSQTKEELAAGREVADMEAALLIKRREHMIAQAKVEAIVAQNRLKARQEDQYSAAQRLAFLEEATALQDTLLDQELEIAQTEKVIAEKRASFSKSQTDILDEVADKTAALSRVETERANKQRQIERERIRVMGQLKTENAKVEAEMTEIQLKEQGARVEISKKGERQKGIVIKTGQEQQLEYIRKMTEYEKEEAEIRVKIAEDEWNRKEELVSTYSATASNLVNGLTQNAVVKSKMRSDAEIAGIEGMYAKRIAAAGEDEELITRLEQEKADKIKKIEDEQRRREIKAAQIHKIIAVSEAIQDTRAAVIKALRNPPGPPFTIPQAIATGIFGAANVAVIASQPIPRYAKGTKRIMGPGDDTSDSVHAMLSRNERVVDAKNNRRIGFDLTNDQLATAAQMYRSIALGQPALTDSGIIKAIQANTEVLKRKPTPKTEIKVEQGFRTYNRKRYLR